MIEIQGTFSSATIFTDHIDPSSHGQIKALVNQPFTKGSRIRVMPDVHAGKGCVIGLTMTLTDKVCPNLVGVDIGCGVAAMRLQAKKIDFNQLDRIIRQYVPSGMAVHEKEGEFASCVDWLDPEISKHVNIKRARLSMGTLGGGNHFIEVDVDDEGNYYLVIHTGSRHLGLEVATYYQKLAGKACRGKDVPFELAWLEGDAAQAYLRDMRACQEIAYYNRYAIASLLRKKLTMCCFHGSVESVHNFIDADGILRKGSVSAKKGEEVIIPLNMRDGALICVGKGNPDWNLSAPHGAGRLYSRTEAKNSFTLTQFKQEMKGVFSTSVSRGTIDESPMAYKPADEIISRIGDTVDIVKRLRPVYNFKAGA